MLEEPEVRYTLPSDSPQSATDNNKPRKPNLPRRSRRWLQPEQVFRLLLARAIRTGNREMERTCRVHLRLIELDKGGRK